MALRRVAIYGGTFDPVHNGHMEAARNILQRFALDEVIFVPACVPPHKLKAGITSAFHRFAMLVLATEGDKSLLVSTMELDTPERPYAIQTVAHFRAEFGNEAQLFFLMGTDSWLEITSWHDWRELMKQCHFIVVTRPGYELQPGSSANMPIPVIDALGHGCRQSDIMHEDMDTPCVLLTDAAMVDVSATAIRTAARAGDREALRSMVPAAVASYIEKYEVYKN